jgi:hypothetical protein
MKPARRYDAGRVDVTPPSPRTMELKTARLTLLIDPNKKAAFERLCAQQDLTPSQVVRQMIRDYLVQHGADYVPSGEAPAAPRNSPRAARTAPSAAGGRKVAAGRKR